MASIKTKYLGIDINSPVIVAAGPKTADIESIKKCEESGAGAVVLKSLFQEQIEKEVDKAYEKNQEFLAGAGGEAFGAYHADFIIDRYMKLLTEAKKSVSIPVIASICCKNLDSWIEYAKRFVSCGADAIELDYYPIASNAKIEGKSVDKALFEFATVARKHISCPVVLKIGKKYSSLANVISTLDDLKIDGTVLFNKFYAPDIDIDKLSFVPGPMLSSAKDYTDSLRWIALLSGEVKMDLIANTGIHSAESAIKMILAGAKSFEICSVVMEKGYKAITDINDGILSWMEKHGYNTIFDFAGKLAQEMHSEGYEWERTQFLRTIK